MTLPIPENFKTIYLKAKMENNSDIELAAQFYVDPKTLIKWKKQTGIKKEDYEKQRNPRLMPDDFKQLYITDKEKGLLDEEIAKEYFISIYTLNRWKRVVGFKPRQFANMAGLRNYKRRATEDLPRCCTDINGKGL